MKMNVYGVSPKIIYPGENMPIAPKLGPNSITEGLQLAVSCHLLEPCWSFLPDCKENLSVDLADYKVSIDLKWLKSLLLLNRMKPRPSFFSMTLRSNIYRVVASKNELVKILVSLS